MVRMDVLYSVGTLVVAGPLVVEAEDGGTGTEGEEGVGGFGKL